MTTARPPARPARASLPGARQGFALATALLCLLAQLSGAAHLALVSHVRCLEHDALVHADPSHGAAVAGQLVRRGAEAEGVPTDLAQHADDHCFVAGLRRREPWAVARLRVRAVEPAVQVAPQAWLRLHETPAPPVPLLRLAPKASPPVVLG